MGIVSLVTDVAGQIQVNPRRVKLVTTDNLATVTTAGYLNAANLQGLQLSPTDFIDCVYSYNPATNSGTNTVFTNTVSNGVITLVTWVDPGNVLLPVVSGDFATFNGTTGQIKDSGYLPSNAAKTTVVMAGSAVVANHIALFQDTAGTIDDTAATAINNGNIQAGLSGTAGALISFPSGALSGNLQLKAVNSAGNFNAIISNASLGQASTWSLADPGTATANILQAPAALVSGNLNQSSGTAGLVADSGIAAINVSMTKVFTLTFTQLATAGKVNIQVHPSGTSQYFIQDVKVLKSTGLSGGGGDRLLAITDGTLVFNNAGITAALLGTPIFTLWGGTGNPIPISASDISTAGADIYFQYTGGTTDYTAGSVQIAVTYVKVTA